MTERKKIEYSINTLFQTHLINSIKNNVDLFIIHKVENYPIILLSNGKFTQTKNGVISKGVWFMSGTNICFFGYQYPLKLKAQTLIRCTDFCV